MSERSQRAAQELGCGTNSGTPRSQDISLEVDSGSGTGSVPATQVERKKVDAHNARNFQELSLIHI
eukprot:8874314-Prorocentrum_lima.AAC.1